VVLVQQVREVHKVLKGLKEPEVHKVPLKVLKEL
jgi:hypothetical protein